MRFHMIIPLGLKSSTDITAHKRRRMSNRNLSVNNQPLSLQINLIENSKANRPTRITTELVQQSAASCNSNAEMIKTCIGEYVHQRKSQVCPGLNDAIMILTTPNRLYGADESFGIYTVKNDIGIFNVAITCCSNC